MNTSRMIKSPPKSEAVAQPKGWMNNESLQFVKFSRPTKEFPNLMVLHGHSSHKKLSTSGETRLIPHRTIQNA